MPPSIAVIFDLCKHHFLHDVRWSKMTCFGSVVELFSLLPCAIQCGSHGLYRSLQLPSPVQWPPYATLTWLAVALFSFTFTSDSLAITIPSSTGQAVTSYCLASPPSDQSRAVEKVQADLNNSSQTTLASCMN